jgi:hypothetical protein
MTFRVTHYDLAGRRHRIEVMAASNRSAMAQAELMFGEARQMHAICVTRPKDADE